MTTYCCRVSVERPGNRNPRDVSTDLLEPMLTIPQLPDVEPTPTRVYNSDNRGTRNIYSRKFDLDKFGYTAGCRACEVHRAGLGKNTLRNAGNDLKTQWRQTRLQRLDSRLHV